MSTLVDFAWFLLFLFVPAYLVNKWNFRRWK